jgi:membrane associated rhomboid family serine protease
MASRTARPRKTWPLGDHGLSLVLLALFLVSWLGQFLVELMTVKQQNQQHGESFQWGEFWPEFWQSTLENWQSEFLQLLTFVVLTAYLIHRGSPESKAGT